MRCVRRRAGTLTERCACLLFRTCCFRLFRIGDGVSPDPIVVPRASNFRTGAKLALTLAEAVPLLAMVRYFARPAPAVASDAPEAEDNLPRQHGVLARQRAITVSAKSMLASPPLRCR